MATFFAATGAQAAGAGATQAAMLASQTAAFGSAGTAATTAALGYGAGATAASTLTIGSLIPSAATAANVASGLSIMAMVRQGQAAKVGADVQADRLKQDATIREVDRRRRLVASLASQNATRAASGIAFGEGSSKNLALEDIRQGEGSILTDRGFTSGAITSIQNAGTFRRNTSYINAGASLINQIDRNVSRG